MTIRQIGIVLRPLVLLVLSLSFGCAQQMKTLQAEQGAEVTAAAQIQSVTVSDDASRVEVVSDKPIVYTYYMLESPPRVIVDIAQTVPGKQPFPLIVNKSGVAQIDITKHEFGSGVLSRIDILLNSKAEITASLDQFDKKKLTILIPDPATEKQEPVKTAVAVPAAVQETVPPAVAAAPKPATGENAEPVQPVSPSGADNGQGTAEPAKVAPATGDISPIAPAEPLPQAGASSPAIKPGERVLSAISVGSAGIQLDISGEPDSFKAFKLTGPDRLVIDIPKTRNAMASKIVDVNAFSIGKARVGSAQDKLRVVFDATGIIPQYSVNKNRSGLLIAFGENAKNERGGASNQEPLQAAVASVPATATAESPVPQPASSPMAMAEKAAARKYAPGTVEEVEFTQVDGISRITIRTSGSCTADEPVKSKKGYSLTLKGCRLPGKLQRQLDTSGFESAIKSIAPFSVAGRAAPETRLAVNLSGSLPNTLHKGTDLLEWDFTEPVKAVKTVKRPKIAAASLKPASQTAVENELSEVRQEQPQSKPDKAMEDAFALEKASQTALKPGKKYTGRKVTLEFSDADIKKIFQLLAEVSNQNILVSDDVTGTISLKLVNVPWDQALDVILENKGLGMQREGNIVQIRPRTKMKSLDDEAVEMRITEEKKMPLSTVIFDVNFATLSEIESQFKNLKSKRSDASISTDARTNKIIVVDIDPNISKMRKLLDQLDVPERQVMIEARIVEASSTFARDIGVRWGFGYTDGSASNIFGANNVIGTAGGVVSAVLPTATTGGIATGVSFGKLLSNFQLDMRLSAAASIGQIKIVSTPKVMTVNNKAAKISQGQMIPYQNTSSTDGAKTEFIEAALSLEVTPHITADGNVTMKIKASNNTAGVGNPPPINKKEATTELVVKNGETTVIGGIYVDSDTEGETGVPYLQDIPLLGNLFKSNSSNKVKNEMLIFITPRIMN